MSQERIVAQEYLLSFWDFEVSYEPVMKVYKPGERVTRDNFVPFIIWSFAISRGTPQGQAAAMEWVHQHTGFDQKETGKNFNLAGGIASLSEGEQQYLLQAIKGVRKHGEEKILDCSDLAILRMIEKEFLEATDFPDSSMLVRSRQARELSWNPFLEVLNERIDYKLEYDRTHKNRWFW